MITSKEVLMKMAHDNPKEIIESGFSVVNKDKEIVPFIFNQPQNIFYDEMTYRDDLVKAGQLGISTLILAIETVKFLLIPNAWAVCISHEEEATKRLFEKVDFYLKNLPPWLKTFYIPGKTAQGDITNEVMHSKFYIGTAGARAFGRGDTPHYVHMSESSRWKDHGRIMTGLIRAVPLNDPHTWIVKETTANGQGTMHHLEYQRAKRGESEFRNHFLPWFSNPDYRIENTGLKTEDLTQEEKRLIMRFPKLEKEKNKGYVDLAAIEWYRKMERSLGSEEGRNPHDMMKQEFPSDDVEAFLFSGNPVFPVDEVEKYKATAPSPIFVGNLEGVVPNISLSETDKGWLKIWRKPMFGSQYIIFADIAESGDYCSAHVLAKKSWKIVAHFHARIESHLMGTKLNELGHYYNDAEIAVEINNMGQSTIDRLRDLSYPHLYMRETLNEKEKKVSKQFGWRTDVKTKPLIIGHMQNLVRTGQVPYIDLETAQELSTYVLNEDGSMGASEGNYDDRVISISGAYYILKLHPFRASTQSVQSKTTPAARYRALRTKKIGGKGRWRR